MSKGRKTRRSLLKDTGVRGEGRGGILKLRKGMKSKKIKEE